MALQVVNLGDEITGNGGDKYRDAHTKINANFTEIDVSLNLKANTADVDAKNVLQDAAITSTNNLAAAAIPNTAKGVANGVATLDGSGKVVSTQLPDINITNELGQSMTYAVSQKLLTDVVGDIDSALTAINGV